ncbi:peptidase U32 family protein [Microaceticoccus formicicus]|uniref:peptidase U32 family protein n=1 Tax=Microaceticoccus formicicus TaxID=3118105 RepID=UPI003CD03FDC|nr:U32 family peptidase [Peptoniphilaceae bacterium AMB_02]
MKKVELLAPAGDLLKLKTAIEYGADAVYLAGKNFGLRTASKNFTDDQIKEATEYCHSRGKKIYITMNIIPHNSDLVGIGEYVRTLEEIGVDAVIVSDAGMVSIIRRITKTLPIHLSTQASVTNYETVNFWYDYGLRRVILARELSLDEISEIKQNIPDDMELEMFVHGAMCISYSGRCLLSNYMVGRDANLGDCAHACRWKYSLVEEKRPGEYFPISEDESGAFILNSKDLCLLDGLDRVLKTGVDSIKIEGRVKSQYYVATVVRSYRMAVDAYYENRLTPELAQSLITEIRKASHRDFTSGFTYEQPDENAQIYGSSSYIRNYDFVGVVLDYDIESKMATVEQRNKIEVGDKLEIFGPNIEHFDYEVVEMKDKNGKDIESAPHAQQIIKLKIDHEVKPWYMIRKPI